MKSGAVHGGAFFGAIGEDFRHLERSRDVISADVLDAWFDPSPRVLQALEQYLPFLVRTSPPVQAEGLLQEISNARGIPEESLLLGAGSSSLLFHFLPRLIDPGSTIVLLDPTYSEYLHLCENVLDAPVARCRLDSGKGFKVPVSDLADMCRDLEPGAVFLVNPNSPTGRLWPRADLLRWLDSVPPATLVLVDETYIDFCRPSESLESEAVVRPNFLVVKSMSKAYALSGLRAGYLVAHPDTINRLSLYQPPWPVSLIAQVAAVEALRDPIYYRDRWSETARLRTAVCESIARMGGYRVYPSDANFYLIECDDAPRVAASLQQQSIFVRDCRSVGSLDGDRFLRIAVKDAEQNARIEAALEQAL